ncbi:MAG: hypothetical protein WCB62_06880, partial [Pseudolabrys sp.]
FAVIDVVLTSQRERRTSGLENFQSSAKKDFFNTIRRHQFGHDPAEVFAFWFPKHVRWETEAHLLPSA